MKHGQKGMLVAAVTLFIAGSAMAGGPLRDGEHSVGVDLITASARGYFHRSAAVLAQVSTLERAGFVAREELPIVAVVQNDCPAATGSSCSARYDVSVHYDRADQGERVVMGHYSIFHYSGHQRDMFVADRLDTDGLGQLHQIDGDEARAFMKALEQTGVHDDTGLVGATTEWVGRVNCSHAVVPNPVTGCTIEFQGKTLVVPQAAATVIESSLLEAGALINTNMIGACNTAADLVVCHRVIVPTMPSNCEFLVGVGE